jgi:uncharacterized protein (TIGR02217 family)
MAFRESRLSSDVERGAEGGPRFLTNIIQSLSGVETRAIMWSDQRAEYQVSFGYDNSLFRDIQKHFYNMRGRAYSFPFWDWADYQIGDLLVLNQFSNFAVGNGSQTAFPIYKPYVSDTFIYSRRIEKPIAAGARAYVNNAEKIGGFTINRVLGTLNFSVAPGNLIDVGIAANFHVPVRYDTDQISVDMITTTDGRVPSVPLVEVKGESTIA